MSNIITEDALLSAIWYRLNEDTELNNIMSGVRLGDTWVDENTEFPYLVHKLDSSVGDEFFILNNDYLLDFWDYNQLKTRILEMIGRVRGILNQSYIGFVDGDYSHMKVVQPWRDNENMPEVVVGRLFFDDGDFIGEDTKDIWHYASTWTIRATMTEQELQNLGL